MPKNISKGHKSAVIWLTGLPGSGKSTIAVELQSLLREKNCGVYILDGDDIRRGLNQDLGFSPQDRHENIRRAGHVARMFAEAGFLVITAFISPYRSDRKMVREMLPPGGFIEVFVKTSLAQCERRDPKGHYKKARCGEIKDFTGVSAPYEEPVSPEIVVDTEKGTPLECALAIAQYLEDKGYILR